VLTSVSDLSGNDLGERLGGRRHDRRSDVGLLATRHVRGRGSPFSQNWVWSGDESEHEKRRERQRQTLQASRLLRDVECGVILIDSGASRSEGCPI
jgi:hypothetical protein